MERQGQPIEMTDKFGFRHSYSDNGKENVPTILFLHGAVTDERMWQPHRDLIGDTFRTVALTQRYHGSAAWPSDGPPYGVATHAQDLVGFLDEKDFGPVHLVAWSYACHVAFEAGLKRPELFRSIFVYEPGVPSFLSDELLVNWSQDAEAAFSPLFAAVMESNGDVVALEQLVDLAGQAVGYFAKQAPEVRRVQLENAKTMTYLLLHQQTPPSISCEQLSRIAVPTLVAYGALSRPLYALVGAAAQRSIGGNHHLVIEEGTHMWPIEKVDEFTRAILAFVEMHR